MRRIQRINGFTGKPIQWQLVWADQSRLRAKVS